jgi:hypothetical protein
LAGDFRNKVSPAAGKWATANFDALAKCCRTRRLNGPFNAKPDIEHVRRCRKQIDLNFEAAIFDCSLHEDLGFQRRADAEKPMVDLFVF